MENYQLAQIKRDAGVVSGEESAIAKRLDRPLGRDGADSLNET